MPASVLNIFNILSNQISVMITNNWEQEKTWTLKEFYRSIQTDIDIKANDVNTI